MIIFYYHFIVLWHSLIRCKAADDLVLTCTLPNATPGDGSPPPDLLGQSVVLQPAKPEKNGRANQIWAAEKETGFIFGLAAEFRDRGENLFVAFA